MTILKGEYVNRKVNRRNLYDWFPVRYSSTNRGKVDLGRLSLPKEYLGKRIKLKVEVLE